MSDPLSVSASILTVVAAGIAIAKGLHQIADGIASAGEQVRTYATRFYIFSNLLQEIDEQLMKKPPQFWSRAEHLILEILDVCERVMEPIKQIQKTLNSLLLRYANSPGKIRQISMRIYWLFRAKDKMLWHFASLEALTNLLNTTLATMRMRLADTNTANFYIQQNAIQICVAEVRRSLSDPTRLQVGGFMQPRLQLLSSPDNTGHTLESSLSQLTISQGEIDTRRNNYSTGLIAQTPSSLKLTSAQSGVDAPVDATTGAQALILSPLQNHITISDPDDIDANEIADVDHSINETLEQRFDDSAQEIWEDLRSTSRKLLRYAEEVLHASSHPPVREALESENTKDGVKVTELDSDPNYFTIETNHGRVRLPNFAARGLKYNHGPDDFSMTIAEDDNRSSNQEAVADHPVTLKIIDGKSYKFPYSSVRRWEDAKTAFLSLKYPSLFKAADTETSVTLRDVLDKEEFTLKGPDDQYIVPRFWAETVQPGWTVELLFDDSVSWQGRTVEVPSVETYTAPLEPPLNQSPTPPLEQSPTPPLDGLPALLQAPSPSPTPTLEKLRTKRSSRFSDFFRRLLPAQGT